MVIFVPAGDLSGDDATRKPLFYDAIFDYLLACGAQSLVDGTAL